MWKNIVERGRPQMTLWRMRIACWIPRAINTHSEYIIPITFPLQQRLYESASVLHHKYIVCLVNYLPCVWHLPVPTGLISFEPLILLRVRWLSRHILVFWRVVKFSFLTLGKIIVLLFWFKSTQACGLRVTNLIFKINTWFKCALIYTCNLSYY
jgi:hypothetical protein